MKRCAASILILILLTLFSCAIGKMSRLNSNTSKPVEKLGRLTANEVWQGNIIIKDDVIVPRGVILTIQSGAVSGFSTASGKPLKLEISGTLYAEGNTKARIIFAPAKAPYKGGDWFGIVFHRNSLNSRLDFCVFQYHQQIVCRTDSLRMTNCLITNGSKAGIDCDAASPIIENCEISKHETGIKCANESNPEISQNVIRVNKYGIVCESRSAPKIMRNIISDNRQDGIICYSDASPAIDSNNIIRNGGWAVYDGGRLTSNFIAGNRKTNPNVVDTKTGRFSEQFYGVDRVNSPRSTPVEDAGPRRY